MLIGECFCGFEFNDERPVHKEVGKVISEDGSVFIMNRQSMLLKDFQSLLTQTVGQAVFVNFFKMAVPKK